VKEKVFDWAIEIAKKIAMKREQRRGAGLLSQMKHKLADALSSASFVNSSADVLRACITAGSWRFPTIFFDLYGRGNLDHARLRSDRNFSGHHFKQ
jgi:hypothetical protein